MTARAPLTEAEKQYIYDRKQQGASLKTIAPELSCSQETARKWWREKRDGKQPRARGRPRIGTLGTYPEEIRERAVKLKETHPHCGPATVKIKMIKQWEYRAEELPSDARLSVLFKERCPEAVQPRQKHHYPERAPPTASVPHECWQIDEKEAVPLGEQKRANILNVCDPVSALLIASHAVETTTEKAWRKLSGREVQNALRAAFLQWGMPRKIQTDHGKKYVGNSQEDFPSLFTLWLVGLNIEHVLSRKQRPTDQPHVERSHRTVGDMTWKDQPCDSVEQLQTLLDDCCQQYNHLFPSRAAGCDGRPPLDVHPEAIHSGQAYDPSQETELFRLMRVDAYLAGSVWTRRVSGNATARIGRHEYYISRTRVGETLSIRFIPGLRVFRFESSDGSWTLDRPARGLDKDEIIGILPSTLACPNALQLPLPFEGV